MGSTDADHSSRRGDALIARYLDPRKGWGPKLDDELRALLRGSVACAAEYDRAVTLHRLMVGADPLLPSGFERGRMMAALLLEPTPSPAPMLSQVLARWMRPAMIACGAALALALVVVVARPAGQGLTLPDDVYVGQRGGELYGLTVGVGVGGVTADGREYEAMAGDSALYLDDYVRVTTTRVVDTHRWVLVVGLQDGRDPIWYEPDPEHGTTQSVAAEEGKMIPLGGSADPFEVKLFGRHVVGPLQVVAVFSAEPIEVARMAEILRKIRELPPEAAFAFGFGPDLGTMVEESLELARPPIIRILSLEVRSGSRTEANDG